MDVPANGAVPRVSIAMATYNGAENILGQLRSLAQQTLLPFEIVVTDDGSTDNTLEIVREFASTVSFPVKAFSNPKNLGFANNFLRAASLCEGDLIAFCDQDDVWLENKLELCAAWFQDPDVMLCIHSGSVWDGTEVTGQRYPGFAETAVHAPSTLNPMALIPGFAMVFRSVLMRAVPSDARPRNIFAIGGSKQIPMAHDQWICLLSIVCGKVVTMADNLVLYRQHVANVAGAPRKRKRFFYLLLSLQDTLYDYRAEMEEECAKVAEALSASELLSETQRTNAAASAKVLAARARFHALRHAIFDRRGFFGRTKAFFTILSEGGYKDDTAGNLMGRRAALKDFVLGVTGIYKLTAKQNDAV